MKKSNKWKNFLQNGDIESYLDYKKEQKRDTELSSDRNSYGIKRRDRNKKH